MEGRIIHSVQELDARFNQFTENYQIPLLVQAMNSLTSLGSVHFNLILLTFILSFGRTSAAKTLGLGLSLTWIAIYSIKNMVKRNRPEKKIQNILARASFPSGHSGTAFMTAIVFSAYFNREILFLGLAATVAFSRVYLEDHYLSDAVIGSLIGLLIGLLAVSL